MRKSRLRTDRLPLRYEGLFTFSELCAYLQVSRWSLKRWLGMIYKWKKYWTGFSEPDLRYKIEGFPQPRKRQGEAQWIFLAQEVGEYLKLGEEEKDGFGFQLVDPLLTLAQVAFRTNRSVRSVWNWIADERLSAIRFGHRVTRVSQYELTRFINENQDRLNLWKKIEVTPMSEYRKEVSKKRVTKVGPRGRIASLSRTFGVTSVG